MAKISANYEVVYIIDPAQGEEAVAATVAKFQSLAEQNATDVVVDEWGKRRLAYAIDYKTARPSSPRSWIVSWALPRVSCVP